MAILIVLMVPTKIQQYIIVLNHKNVATINLLVLMDVALIKDGYVIMITIAAMVPMKEKNAILNIKLAQQTNSAVKTSNVFVISTDAMAKTIVATILMKLDAVSSKLPYFY